MRDFVGYGNRLPDVSWPGDARVAVSFVLNFEEGGVSLNDAATARALVLDDAPVAMQLAVFLAEFGAQKHAGEFLRNHRHLQGPRSALHALFVAAA